MREHLQSVSDETVLPDRCSADRALLDVGLAAVAGVGGEFESHASNSRLSLTSAVIEEIQ